MMNNTPNDETRSLDDLDLISDDFENSWNDGDTPSIEYYLSDIDPQSKSNLFEKLVSIEIDKRQNGIKPFTIEEAKQRFPEMEDIALNALLKSTAKNDDTISVTDDETKDASIGDVKYSSKTPETLADYDLLKRIGQGGMGVVYLAEQKALNRKVALKMIRAGSFANDLEIQRFHGEAKTAAQLDHFGIVPVYEAGFADGQHYLSMAFVEGESLSERIRNQPFAPHEAAVLVKKIAEAVAYAHERGVIHRDLKPANILLDKQSSPKITDFGLAKFLSQDSDLTSTGQVLGTPSYMPPEQAKGILSEVAETADIYSIGAILYSMLCGRPPFVADSLATTLQQVIEQEPIRPKQFNDTIPLDLETICLKCLEKSRAKRYTSAQDLVDELDRFLNHMPILARPISGRHKFWRWCRRNPIVASLLAAFILTHLVGLTFTAFLAILAHSRAERAEEGTRIAVSTLQSVINNVQYKLKNIPAARDIRQELLKSALDDLQKLSGSILVQASTDKETAYALLDLATLYREMGKDDEGLGSRVAAENHFKQANKILKVLVEQNPDDDVLAFNYGHGQSSLGDIYFDKGRFNEVEVAFKEAKKYQKIASELKPEKLEYRYGYAWSLANWGDFLFARGRHKEAITYFEQSEEVARKLSAAEPANAVYKECVADSLEKQGDAYLLLNQPEKAGEIFEISHQIYIENMEKHPEDHNKILSYSTSCERKGDYYKHIKEYDKAKDYYDKMLIFTLKAIEYDPENLDMKFDLTFAYKQFIKLSHATNDNNMRTWANQELQKVEQELKDKGYY